MRRVPVLLTFAGLIAGLAAPGASAQSEAPGCVGETDAAQVPQRPGPPVRFGINARAVTGQIGPSAPLADALNKAGIPWSLAP